MNVRAPIDTQLLDGAMKHLSQLGHPGNVEEQSYQLNAGYFPPIQNGLIMSA